MALKDAKCSNSPETMKALVGETIVGVIADYDGAWWLVVKSGHALVMTRNGSYWTESPDAVKTLIAKRKADLGAWADETRRIMAIDDAIA